MSIQITGKPSIIAQIARNQLIPDGRLHNRAGLAWIEVDKLTDEDCSRNSEYKCKVHDSIKAG